MESSDVSHVEELESDLMPETKRYALPTLGLRVSERRLLLGVMDMLLLCVALAAALLLTTSLVPDTEALFAAWKWYVTLTAVWLIYAALFDVYNLARAASSIYSARASGSAALLTSLTYLAIPWLTPTLVNRSYGFMFVLLAVSSVITLARGVRTVLHAADFPATGVDCRRG